MGFLKKSLPAFLYKPLFNFYQDYIEIKQSCYGFEGEDLILNKLFFKKKNGFYIDIGAYHPKTYSNTYLFYKKGCRGINIDANPLSIKKFEKFRKRDININIGIAQKEGTLKYYMFEEAAINTFSENVYRDRLEKDKAKFIGVKEIPTQPLKSILDKLLPEGQKIDFMSVDVEGFEWEVLLSNDWHKYRPEVVLIEEYNRDKDLLENSRVYDFFKKQNYGFVAKTFSTFVFIDKNSQ